MYRSCFNFTIKFYTLISGAISLRYYGTRHFHGYQLASRPEYHPPVTQTNYFSCIELDPLVVENFSLNSRFFLQTKEERKKISYEKLLDRRYG